MIFCIGIFIFYRTTDTIGRMNQSNRDNIYAEEELVKDFTFDERVVAVFPDMIERSVPGYRSILSYMGLWSARFAQPNTTCYDLGCSLGASTWALRQHISAESCQIVAVDNSPAMIDRCTQLLALQPDGASVELRCENLQETVIENASVVVLNFTLQFIPMEDRLTVLTKIYEGMVDGGILILSEKVAFPDRNKQSVFTDIHHDFKRAQGYSELEIAQKRTSLENVLIPETPEAHQKRLVEAGFSSAEIWYQAINFLSFVAIKGAI